jgi:cysteinyl-tRNA synthetase
LLTSVPYRNQLNFTFDGLRQAATSVERLRNFRQRLTETAFADGATSELQKMAADAVARMKAALEDDLNTAQAQAAIFEMVRAANIAMDAGQTRKADVAPFLAALEKFDEIFAVLHDDDAGKMRQILEWAQAEGHEKDISPDLLALARASGPSDHDVAAKITEMEQARKTKNFAASDKLRAELTSAGILVEITKDGVRWRRK